MRGGKPRAKIVSISPTRSMPNPPPAWLTAGAKREWARCAVDLERRGILFDGALASLATYCALADQVEQIGRVLGKDGPLADDGKALRLMVTASAQMRMLATELGLSVVSRSRSFQGKAADEQAWGELDVG